MTDSQSVTVVKRRTHWIEYNRGRGAKPWGVYRQIGDTRAWVADFASQVEAQTWINSRQQ